MFRAVIRCAIALPLTLCLLVIRARADELIADDSSAAELAIATLHVPKGFRVELFAAAPQLANPVAICLDERGAVFVAEAHRLNRGTTENRTSSFLLDDDLQSHSVNDRLKMYEKWASRFDGGMQWFTKYSDQIRRLQDTDGDGRADASTVFAADFNSPLDGLAAGVIARQGKVYVTCIPNLWKLQDRDGDGRADERAMLVNGFGVNAAYLGHDLHGLIWGPDGKLYFSVGDRGFDVKSKEGRHFHGPRTGAVFRCNPDGSQFEVVHRGLRNPQELAFDQFGNLFTCDNNCDLGDEARLVYVVEGGDSGWNMAFQTLPEPYPAGPWLAEKMWQPHCVEQPAWIVPPLATVGSGPAGLAFSGGGAMPASLHNRFFLCNFVPNGGIETFRLEPQGAGFVVKDYADFLKPINATDIEFGYDGKIYISDYVGLNWDGSSRGGRIYTVQHEELARGKEILATAKLFRDGIESQPTAELLKLLQNEDQRVRLRAQFALAENGETVLPDLQAAARTQNPASLVARLHAIWAVAQIAQAEAIAFEPLLALADDANPEIRAQIIKCIGDIRLADGLPVLFRALTDPHPRVQFFAAQSLGKLKSEQAISPLLKLSAACQDDPLIRHAVAHALENIGADSTVASHARDPDPRVRMVCLLALRRMNSPEVARFLTDEDAQIVTEAARAIYDAPGESELDALAAALDNVKQKPLLHSDAFIRRVIAANFRLGQPEHLNRVASIAASDETSDLVRQEAIGAIAGWLEPAPRDRVTGAWRPPSARPDAETRTALQAVIPELLHNLSSENQAEVIRLCSLNGIDIELTVLRNLFNDESGHSNARAAALHMLAKLDHRDGPRFAQLALNSSDAILRKEARVCISKLDPVAGCELLELTALSEQATIDDRQHAISVLTQMKSQCSQQAIERLFQGVTSGTIPKALRLDVIESMKTFEPSSHDREVVQFVNQMKTREPLGEHELATEGGNAEAGRQLFFGSRAQCAKCHAPGTNGVRSAPDLSQLKTKFGKDIRRHVVESIIDPNKKIADGFGTVSVLTLDGISIAGTLISRTTSKLVIETHAGAKTEISADDIEEVSEPLSAMPDAKGLLSPREIRDVVEFVVTGLN